MIAMLPLSVIIPLLDTGLSSGDIFQNGTFPILFDNFEGIGNNAQQTVTTNNPQWSLSKILVIFYGLGVLVHLTKMLLSVLKIVRIRHRAESHTIGGVSVLSADIPLAFSCFRWIFLPLNENKETDPSIVEHEKLHGKAWHTLDLGLTELFVALFWFNPFVYLFRRDLKTVHEYQVDSMILQSNIKKSDYLQLMLNNLNSSHKLVSLYNYFNGLTIKKRVKMIAKEKSSKWKLISYLLIIPVVTIMTMSFTGTTNKEGDIPGISPISDYEKVSLEFGEINPRQQIHKGIDFKAKTGTEVVATADGVATVVEFRKGYGNLIVITHKDGYETRYAHLSGFAIEQGEKVKEGKLIGFVGSTGYSTGPHLHYEVRINGEAVNPRDYIRE